MKKLFKNQKEKKVKKKRKNNKSKKISKLINEKNILFFLVKYKY